MSKRFHLGDVLSITTGRLVAPGHVGAVYDLLSFMTGDNLFTHQLARAADECEPDLLRQHPQLAEIELPEQFEDEDHVETWLAEQAARYGEHLDVIPLARGDHTDIDPLQELAMNHPHLEVVPVVIEDGERP